MLSISRRTIFDADAGYHDELGLLTLDARAEEGALVTTPIAARELFARSRSHRCLPRSRCRAPYFTKNFFSFFRDDYLSFHMLSR